MSSRSKRPRIASLMGHSESVAIMAATVRSNLSLVIRQIEEDALVAGSIGGAITHLRTALRALYAIELGGDERITRCYDVCVVSLQSALSGLQGDGAWSDASQTGVDRIATALASLHAVQTSIVRR